MSHEATNWVRNEASTDDRVGGDPRKLLLLLSLADVADQWGGNAFPSKSRLARESCSDPRTVQRHLSAMVKTGLLEVQQKSSAQRPTTYRILGVFSDDDDAEGRQFVSPKKGHRGETDGRAEGRQFVSPGETVCLPRGDRRETNRQSSPIKEPGTNNNPPYSPPTTPIAENCSPGGSLVLRPSDFDAFWDIYPRHVAKPKAFESWTKATRTTPAEIVLAVPSDSLRTRTAWMSSPRIRRRG